MDRLRIMDKYCRIIFYKCLLIFLLINLFSIDVFPSEQLPEKNKIVIGEQHFLDKEEAVFKAIMECLNLKEKQLEKEKSNLHFNKRRYPRAKSLPINTGSRYIEQEKNRQITAYYQLGYQYAQDGNNVLAITQFEAILKYDSCNKNVCYNLGYLYAKTGKYEEAVKAYKRALELSKDKNDRQIYYNLALIYDKDLKDKKESSRYYKKFLENSNDSNRDYREKE